MDLSTMQSRLNHNFYVSSTLFEKDVSLIVHNCKVYNGPQTTYFRHAEDFWVEYVQLAKKHEIHTKLALDENNNVVPLSTLQDKISDPTVSPKQHPAGQNLMSDETIVHVRR
jgi:hypothetical protein